MTKARRLVSIARLRCAYDATSGLSGLFNIWDNYFVFVFVITLVTIIWSLVDIRSWVSVDYGTNQGYIGSYYNFLYTLYLGEYQGLVF